MATNYNRPDGWDKQISKATVSLDPDAQYYVAGIEVVDGLVTKVFAKPVAGRSGYGYGEAHQDYFAMLSDVYGADAIEL